ncbi:MAG: AAA family ATPase, partial [Vicinamibacteria bacterium]
VELGAVELPPVPPWLLEYIRERQSERLHVPSNGNGDRPHGDEETTVPEGERHKFITSRAGKLRNAGLRGDVLLTALLEISRTRCRPPLPEDEVARIASDATAKWDESRQFPIGSTEERAPRVLVEPYEDFHARVSALPPLKSLIGEDSCDEPLHAGPMRRDAPAAEVPVSTVGEFISARELAREAPRECIVEDAVYRDGITVLAGESGSGKSFVVADMGAAVSEGHRWHGRDVIQGGVAYVAFEADALSLRCQALEAQERGIDDLHFLKASDPLSPVIQRDGSELPSLGEEVLTDRLHRLSEYLRENGRPPIVLLAIDTVRASLSGSEDSSSDVSAYLRAIRRILGTLPGAGALLNHHTGWQDGETQRKRERGSSAFRGNVEITLYLAVANDSDTARVELELSTLKARDSERRVPLRLIRRRIDLLGFDKFGNPLSSCIIESDPRTYKEMMAEREAAESEAAKTKQEALAREVLTVIRDHRPTSLSVIRGLVRGKRDDVYGAVAQLQRARLISKDGHRDPFTITEAGEQAIR